MWFGILGHLEVRRSDGTAMRIAGPARRQVLAALLCRPDSLITSSALIEDVWGMAPPRSALSSLRSHIARLRVDLGRGGEDSVLVTEGNGYRLCVGTDGVDAGQFETLVHDGGRAADPQTAVARYDAALALWRDEPYVEFGDAPFAVLERIRLGELRALARERRTDLVLALGAAAELIGELEQRVRSEPYRERGWEQLTVALYRADRQADALDACQRARQVLLDDLGVDPGPALQTLEVRLLRQDPDLLVRVPEPAVLQPLVERCPYFGLAGYTEQDAALFVGRERLTSTLAGRLADQSVVVVTGASGVGKSSLVRAGVVPALRAGALPGSAAWRIEIRTPSDPVLTDPDHRPDLLVLDQAEQMFAGLERDRRDELVARLARYIGEDEGRLVLVLRSDFYGRLADVETLAPVAEKAAVLVGPMRADELRRALVEPAAAVGLRLEDELVETIMDEIAGQPEPLPLLSEAMVRTWQRRDGNRLTLAGYRRSGQLGGALETAAEECYTHLDPPQQRAARHLLVRLAIRTDTGWVRRPGTRTDWDPPDPSDQAAMYALIAARLVVADERRVEITHDALLGHWPRLRDWLDERSLAAELLQHLDQAAGTWRTAGRQDSDLYRGPRLSAALDWRAEHPEDVAPAEDEFLDASARAADAELQAARAHTRRLRRVVIALAAVVVLAVAGGIGALYERSSAQSQAHRAERAARTADAGRLAALSGNAPDTATANLLALAGYRLQNTPETRSALLAAVERTKAALWHVQFPARVFGVAPTPDGSRVVASTSTTAMVVDPATHRQLASVPLPSAGVGVVGLTADGREMVVSGWGDTASPEAGRVSVLQVPSGRRLRILTSAADTDIGSAVMTSDSRWLVVLTTEHARGGMVVQVFDAHDWAARPRQFETAGGYVGLAAGRNVIAIEHTDGSVEVRALASLRVLSRLGPTADRSRGTSALGVSPDGSRVARIDPADPSKVGLYNTRAPGSAASTLPAIPAGGTSSIAFSPDGAELAVGSLGGPLGVYRSSDGAQVDAFAGNGGQLFQVAWAGVSTPTALYSVGLDGQLSSWDVGTEPRLFREHGPDYLSVLGALQTNVSVRGSRTAVGFVQIPSTPDDLQGRFAISLRTGRIHLWHSPALETPGSCCAQISVSHDGRLALENVEQTSPRGDQIPGSRIALWDLRTGKAIWRLTVPPPRVGPGLVSAITPNGEQAYIELTSSEIGVYALPSGRQERTFSVRWASDPGILDAWPWAFDPAGRLLVVGAADNGPDNRLGLMDPATGKLLAQTRLGDIGQVMSETWSNDGRLLAVGTYTGTVFLFDAHTLALRAEVSASATVRSISFSPDDQTMVTNGPAGELDFWSVPLLGSELHLTISHTTIAGARAYAWYDAGGRLIGMAPDPTRPAKDMYRGFVFRSDPASLAAEACTLAGGDMSRAQWQRYVGDQPYQHLCPTAH